MSKRFSWLNQEASRHHRHHLTGKYKLLFIFFLIVCGLVNIIRIFTLDDFVYYLTYPLSVLFLFVCAFGDREYKVHSFFLFVYFLICTFMPELDEAINYQSDFLKSCWIAFMIEAAAALAMLTSNIFERTGKYYCPLFFFAAATHIMVISSVTESPIWIIYYADMFKILYSELILLVYFMIMAISINGIYTAFVNLRRAISRTFFITSTSNTYNSKILHLLKKDR